MPTVEEVLRQAGLNDEQIKAIDPKAVSTFNTLMTDAEKRKADAAAALETAKETERKVEHWWANEGQEEINKAYSAKTNADALASFYKTQAEKAKEAGFLPADAPGYVATAEGSRGSDGKFVANANPVPGSPQYMSSREGYNAINNATWYITEHMRLFDGKTPPDALDAVAAEATANRLPFREYVERKYKFAERRQEMTAAQQKAHDDKIRADTVAERDRYHAERQGSNPAIRQGQESRFSKYAEGAGSGASSKYPGSMSPKERKDVVRKEIHDIAAKRATVQ